jgi:aspartate aminotransferase
MTIALATLAPSARNAEVQATFTPLMRFLSDSAYARRDTRDPAGCDFTFGNPHELPLPGVVAALQKWLAPQDKDWFAYKDNEPNSQAVVAAALRERHGLAYQPEDIFLTTGAFAALAVTLAALVGPGDEVIVLDPPWFFYDTLIAAQGATPVRVPVDMATFDLDLDAVAAAITPRTRALVVNSPHNPTGKIYPPATLQGLADLLTDAGERHGQPIALLSDEAYSRILFDGREFPSPARFYPHTFVIYTYGKTLLIPGQRIGYIALPPAMPDREAFRGAILAAQIAAGWAFPNALLQHAIADLEPLSIDIPHLQRKRDWLAGALGALGYATTLPEATFYLLVRSPWPDDLAFAERLAEHKVYVLPGSAAGLPGYVRLSLTASDAMIERALPGFAAAIGAAR